MKLSRKILQGRTFRLHPGRIFDSAGLPASLSATPEKSVDKLVFALSALIED
jgi:hypothetical protein